MFSGPAKWFLQSLIPTDSSHKHFQTLNTPTLAANDHATKVINNEMNSNRNQKFNTFICIYYYLQCKDSYKSWQGAIWTIYPLSLYQGANIQRQTTIHTHAQFKVPNEPNNHVFGLWEEAARQHTGTRSASKRHTERMRENLLALRQQC